MAKGFFVTGTDTGCGKTQITLGLMRRLQQTGLNVQGFKPIAAGAEETPQGLLNEDALCIQQQCSLDIPYAQVNPFVYAPPIAPHLAAEAVGETIDADRIRQTFEDLAALSDRVVVEGAGGWQVPIGPAATLADLANTLNLPVILVVGIRLGCLNHAILTAESIQRSGLKLYGWVANHLDPAMRAQEGNMETLREWLPAPCLGEVPHLEVPTAEIVSRCLLLEP
ncbi:MAG: dethiobiotin synthase [Gammaproteobacteria bacterium]|nr:dethiobiotin synthase [Gammaproteobacteria bacterium]